jgi:hypothetical protein
MNTPLVYSGERHALSGYTTHAYYLLSQMTVVIKFIINLIRV